MMKNALIWVFFLIILASGKCFADLGEAEEAFLSMKPFDVKLHATGTDDIYAILDREITGDFSISFNLKILRGAVSLLLLPVKEIEKSAFSFKVDPWEDWQYPNSTRRVTFTRIGAAFTVEVNNCSGYQESKPWALDVPEPLKVRWIALRGIKESYYYDNKEEAVSFYLDDLVVKELPSGKVLYEDEFVEGMGGAWDKRSGKWVRTQVDGFDYLTSAQIQRYLELARQIVEKSRADEVEKLAEKCASKVAKTLLYYTAAIRKVEQGDLVDAESLAMKIANPLEKSSALTLLAKGYLNRGDRKGAGKALEEVYRTVTTCSNGAQRSYWLTQGGDILSDFNRKRAEDFYERAVKEGDEYIGRTSFHRQIGGRAVLDEQISSKKDTLDVPYVKLLLLNHKRGMRLVENYPRLLQFYGLEYVLDGMKGDKLEKAHLLKFFLEEYHKKDGLLGAYYLFGLLHHDKKLFILSTRLMDPGALQDECLVSIIEFILPDEIGEAQEMTGMISSIDRRDESHAKIAGVYGRKDYSRGIAYAKTHIVGYKIRSLTLNYLIMGLAKKDPEKALRLAREIPDPFIKNYTIKEIQNPSRSGERN